MFKHRTILFSIFGVVIVILACIPSFYFYNQYKKVQKEVAATTKQEDPKAMIARVASHILLPQGEDPTLVSITDVAKLQSQEFFKTAKDGDVLLVFTKAKKAILYRPQIDKIVEVAPVSNASPSASVSPSPAQAVRFFLYNGTTIVGLTKRYEPILRGKLPNAVVVDRDNASSSAYMESILVDVRGNNSVLAQSLAETLGMKLSLLPDGETAPKDTDFLIILGADKK